MCCTFDLHFPDNDVEHLLINFLSILYVSFGGEIVYAIKK